MRETKMAKIVLYEINKMYSWERPVQINMMYI
jgi:hypothetical protein